MPAPGVAERDDAASTHRELLRRADVAMYAAKDAHSRVEPYHAAARRVQPHPARDDPGPRRRARPADQFVLHYQPKIDVTTGADLRRRSARALAAPRLAACSYPDAFLPARRAERADDALTGSCSSPPSRQLAIWRATGLADQRRRQPLGRPTCSTSALPARIAALLAEHGVPGSALELEITESVIDDRPASVPRGRSTQLRRARAADRRRRLRHRLLLPRLPSRPSHRRAQDRPLLHRPHDRRSAQRRDRPLDHRARPRARARVVAEGVEDQPRSTPSPRSAATTPRATTSAARCRATHSPPRPR